LRKEVNTGGRKKIEDLKKIMGAGEWDDVPPVDRHSYDPGENNPLRRNSISGKTERGCIGFALFLLWRQDLDFQLVSDCNDPVQVYDHERINVDEPEKTPFVLLAVPLVPGIFPVIKQVSGTKKTAHARNAASAIHASAAHNYRIAD
jgi:hypothetical protein